MKEFAVQEGANGCFPTIEAALMAIKDIESELEDREAVRITVQGILHFKEPLRITAAALPGPEHPVFVEGIGAGSGFSGGREVSDFEYWKDGIWRAHMPEIDFTRHLYIDGKSAKRPSTPFRKSFQWDALEAEDYEFANLPGEKEETVKITHRPGEVREKSVYSGIATTHTEMAEWKNIRDVEMVFEVGWVHRVVPIERVEFLKDGRLYIKPVEPAFRSARCVEGVQIGGCPSYIENVFELLGKPLEWYFDRNEKMVYVGFEKGDSPGNHAIVVPSVEQIMEVKGELSPTPCHLCFRNLTFQHTTWLFPQKYGVPEVQANQMKFTEVPKELDLEKPYEADHQKVISAVRVLAARDISFEGCTFTSLGTGALQYEFGTRDCRIIGNHFYEIGGSAVSLGDFYLERAHHPKDRREIVRCIEVSNNRIHHTGRDFRGAAAIIGGYVQDVTIAHNEIHDVPYSAISMGWGWGEVDVSVGPKLVTPWKEPTVCMRNRILNNHIHHSMMLLNDGGAVYTLGCMTGTVIAGNYIHASAGYRGEGLNGVSIHGYQAELSADHKDALFWKQHGVPGGIYLDEGSQGIDVFENVLHDVAVPLYYHNQINQGYTRVCYRDNVLNKRPGDDDFPAEIVSCAGLEPEYRDND